MSMLAQGEASKRYYKKHKSECKEKMKERYQKNKEEAKEQSKKRYREMREGALNWNKKIVTAYLPYSQGDKKERFMEEKV